MEKLVIEAAINEQASKEDNPRVPYSVDECIDETIRCADAGAAIVHFHARHPTSGDLEVPGTETYRAIMKAVHRERPDLLMYPTYHPSDRFAHVADLAEDPDVLMRVATIDPGAMNFSAFNPDTGFIGPDLPFVVGHETCGLFFDICKRLDIRYSVVVREPGHVRTAVAYHRAGMIDGPLFFKINLADNMLFGLPPSPAAVSTYLGLVPEDIQCGWMSYVYGPSHWEMARYAIGAGGHVRTGLGDNPVDESGRLTSNEELVKRVVSAAADVGREVATAREALAILRGAGSFGPCQ